MRPFNKISLSLLAVGIAVVAHGQSTKCFFREDWKEIAAALPVTQEHVANSKLLLTLYGPGKDGVKKSNHPEIPNDPFYIWSGECSANWALGLKYANKAVDLSGSDANIVFRSRQSGFRHLHVILKLIDGTWLVSEQSQPYTEGWVETKFEMRDVRWRNFDIEKVVEGAPVENPDLTRVVEIGFTDLMRGGGTPASSRLDWIEVFGKAVDRPNARATN